MSYQTPSGAGALRLHLNENTAGCSPRVLEAIRSLTPWDIATYPDYAATTTRCEAYFDVPAGWVQLVNGLDEGLRLVAATASQTEKTSGVFSQKRSSFEENWLEKRRRVSFSMKKTPDVFLGDFLGEVIYPEPAFEMYRICAEAVGLVARGIPPKPDFAFPLEELIDASARAGAIYLTDPNNPTGLGIPAGAVDRIAAAAPQALVLVDEAYADFSGRTLIGSLLDQRRNVIVGRTFAKGHGLAALRIGALVGHPDALAPLRELMPPFTLNIAALRALEVALDDEPWLRAFVQQAVASRDAIYGFCDARGLHYWRSEANFVLVRVGPDASAVVAALADRGILIRDRSIQPGCDGCVRISAGAIDATTRCLTALEDVLAARHN
ncbi:MAG: histidinol-phosphate aminotransferase family protein [Acidobacteria bacterium]|nr:histidinol-phosphate aminotransferase family protein [Acidobacteriota bacterium]